MVVSPESFPPRKRRPSAGSFVSPHLSDQKLLQSLLIISQEISALQPLKFLLKRNISSLIRKSQLLSTLFEELLRNQVNIYPPSAVLCFEELYIVLQRTKALLEDCSSCSKMWLLMQNESISNTFHELITELSTLLDIFPVNELSLNEDVRELLLLLKRHCLAEKKAYIGSHDKFLRSQVLTMLDDIKLQIVPDNAVLSKIFERLKLNDSTSCRDEIESLEDEVSNQEDEMSSKADIIALIGLVRYAKCVLYDGAASTPKTTSGRLRTAADVNIPADFRCPISLDLMLDPVVVSTGHTYDRSSITLWIESGHNTCPKTGQTLTQTELIPNRALKSLIALWCRDQRIPFESTEDNVKSNGVVINKTALEAVKMTVAFLVNKLSGSQAIETTNRVVHEFRVLAKIDADSRACIADAGALPLLVRFLGSEDPSLQVNAVTTILNLSILEANKTRIMETDGVLNGVIEVLRSAGGVWEAKGNAAATIFSLTGVHAYKKVLGRKTRVVKGLIDLAREGPINSKKDAMVAILSLAGGDREAVGKLIEGGVVDMISEVMEELPEEAVTILEVVVRRGGLMAIAATYRLIPKLAEILRNGSDRAGERVAATLVNICRKGGSEMVAELAAIPGIERVVWEIMGVGTARGRRKAATLLRILRRWASGLDSDIGTLPPSSYSNVNIVSSAPIVLPG